MEAVGGTVHWDGTLPGLDPHGRHRHYAMMIATLARLHAIDPEAAGLADYGKPGNYFARQVDRWTRQYRAAEEDRLEDVERLIRVAAQDRARAAGHRQRPRRLPPRQPDLLARRRRQRGARLGAVDARRSARRFQLPADALGAARGRPQCARRARPAGIGHPDPGRGGGALLPGRRPGGPARARLVLRLQPVPAGRHPPGRGPPAPRPATPRASTPPPWRRGCRRSPPRPGPSPSGRGPEMDLAGRVVAVTGAARGIGRALAEAAQARGANRRRPRPGRRRGGGRRRPLGGRAYPLDVADAEAVAGTLARIEARSGRSPCNSRMPASSSAIPIPPLRPRPIRRAGNAPGR